jgi:hypothetical protein
MLNDATTEMGSAAYACENNKPLATSVDKASSLSVVCFIKVACGIE